MVGLRRGPRKYQLFISHRYDDDDIYSVLRRYLVDARSFNYNNLSVEVDKQLDTGSASATKRSLSSSIKKADALLVFAHSAGEMVEYELERAKHYGVPVISILDPVREASKNRRARSSKIKEQAKCEVRLDEPEKIIAAIRQYARNQASVVHRRLEATSATSPQPLPEDASPKDIAQRMSQPERRQGLVGRIGAFLFGRHGTDAGRDRGT
jgi:hypothetical protein